MKSVKKTGPKTFEFRQCTSILKSTGRKARNLNELRNVTVVISDNCIFHHMYQYFLKGHIQEYTNDFAHWAGENIEERALSEQLSSIDPYAFSSIGEVRNELVRVIDAYIEKFPEPREALPGDEFYFTETITLIYHSAIKVKNLAEFLMAIKYIDIGSIYYHFYEARTRLGGDTDDFSKWFDESLGKPELGEKTMAIDPFMHNMDGIRGHIIDMLEEEVQKDMGVILG